ncbi:hypothetical protein BB561_004984 [Smittium simulii]|uniref:Uncharacterized protein n=1 Tax=Smittium simulii TaxID=133385 RepID=A0A2T9YD42_9FUNG|nr:hypothetical protein BB561_004984 [Smittium simulii]
MAPNPYYFKRQDNTNQQITKALTPTEQQKVILYIICGYTLGILILWHMPVLKYLLYPFKLVTVAFHEFSHAFVGILTGAKILAIKLDPNEGGSTTMTGGSLYCTLPAGYLGSSFIGALMIFCGFNETATKVASVLIVLCLLVTLFWSRNILSAVVSISFIAVIILLWVFWDGKGLKYIILFMGVMSCFYSLWDIVDDLIARKVNDSDATLFAKATGFSSRCCGCLWLMVSLIFFVGSVLLGIVAFK